MRARSPSTLLRAGSRLAGENARLRDDKWLGAVVGSCRAALDWTAEGGCPYVFRCSRAECIGPSLRSG